MESALSAALAGSRGAATGAQRCQNERLLAVGVEEVVWSTVRNLLVDNDVLVEHLRSWLERTTAHDRAPAPRRDERRTDGDRDRAARVSQEKGGRAQEG